MNSPSSHWSEALMNPKPEPGRLEVQTEHFSDEAAVIIHLPLFCCHWRRLGQKIRKCDFYMSFICLKTLSEFS